MRKRFVLLIILLCWLVSCTVTPDGSPTPPVFETPTDLSSVTPAPMTSTPPPTQMALTITATMTPSPAPPTSTPTLKAITPAIVPVCPEQPEVPLAELGLDQEVLIVELYDQESGRKLSPRETGAVIFTFDHPAPQRVPDTATKDDLSLVRYYLAPDLKSLELVYEDPEKKHRQVWRSSWDGKQQWKVEDYDLEPLAAYEYRLEFGEAKYMVYEWNRDRVRSYKSLYSRPLSMHDGRTGQSWDLPPFPDKTIILSHLVIDSVPYLIYLVEKRVKLSESPTFDFFLYNLNTTTAMPAFQWLSGKEWVDFINTWIVYWNGYFRVQVARTYGVDLAIDLDLETVLTAKIYNEIMQAYHLPGGEIPALGFPTGILDSRNGMVFLRYPMDDVPVPFYFLDLKDTILKEYCYTVENERKNNLLTSFSTSRSQRYVAFTRYQLGLVEYPGGIFIKSVEILDLDTGRFARIPDAHFYVLEWGRK